MTDNRVGVRGYRVQCLNATQQISDFQRVHLIEALSHFSKQGKALVHALSRPSIRPVRAKAQVLQSNRKLQPAEVDELVALYESGLGLTELGARFGMHRQTARAHLLRRGIELRSELRVFAPEQLVNLVQLYESGLSTYQLAAQFAAPQSTVRRNLVAAGVVMRSRSGR